MKSSKKSVFAQPFRISYSRTFYHLEVALHLLVLFCIVQIIDWPYVLLFLSLFLLLTWQFFNNHSIIRQYSKDCQIQILDNPPCVHWTASGQKNIYPEHEVKILMTRWFILLQLGKRQTKIRRILLADSFQSLELYSSIRQKMIETKLC